MVGRVLLVRKTMRATGSASASSREPAGYPAKVMTASGETPGTPTDMTALRHELDDFLQGVSAEIAREYERIQRRATEDPGTAGDQGEENWATVLRNWLPPTYQIVTKGRILGPTGEASPQVDVLVLTPAYPRQLLDRQLYLAGGSRRRSSVR